MEFCCEIFDISVENICTEKFFLNEDVQKFDRILKNKKRKKKLWLHLQCYNCIKTFF